MWNEAIDDRLVDRVPCSGIFADKWKRTESKGVLSQWLLGRLFCSCISGLTAGSDWRTFRISSLFNTLIHAFNWTYWDAKTHPQLVCSQRNAEKCQREQSQKWRDSPLIRQGNSTLAFQSTRIARVRTKRNDMNTIGCYWPPGFAFFAVTGVSSKLSPETLTLFVYSQLHPLTTYTG
jgi:hypothetical protein